MSNEELSGVYIEYDRGYFFHDFQELMEYFRFNKNVQIDVYFQNDFDKIFLIKRENNYSLCLGSNIDKKIDKEVNDIEEIKAFYERETSKLGELL